jgi:hypothetical protein
MATKWSTQVLGKNSPPNFGELLKDEYAVILLQGKNVFGDMIYCYVKVSLPNIEKLQAALQNNPKFTPSDFGEVIAAGKGDPPPEVRAELAATYPILDSSKNARAVQAPAPEEKKNWDEY